MENIFCGRSITHGNTAVEHTAEREINIKKKLQPIRLKLRKSINKTIKNYELKYNVNIILKNDFPDIEVIFTVNLDTFKI